MSISIETHKFTEDNNTQLRSIRSRLKADWYANFVNNVLYSVGDSLEAIFEEWDCTVAELAIAYLWSKPVGMSISSIENWQWSELWIEAMETIRKKWIWTALMNRRIKFYQEQWVATATFNITNPWALEFALNLIKKKGLTEKDYSYKQTWSWEETMWELIFTLDTLK